MNSATDICDLSVTTPVSAWRDFYELLKPRMNLLILGTTTVGFSVAARTTADWMRLPNTLIGTALCAASAAILNQYLEREYDGLMPRTAHRPLPTGRISPIHALLLGVATGMLGGFYLLLFVNWMTAVLGSVTLLSYVMVYTPLKRVTTLNTIVGAVPGAVPPMMGWTAVTGSLAPPAWALFGILFVWQIPHFLAIATLYREDYRLGGFKMLPVNDPTLRATGKQMLLYSAALFPVSLLPAMVGVGGEIYTVSAVLLGVGFFAFAMSCATRRTRGEARKLFFASIIYLPVLLGVLMLDRV